MDIYHGRQMIPQQDLLRMINNELHSIDHILTHDYGSILMDVQWRMEVICSCIMTSTYSILHINHIGTSSVSISSAEIDIVCNNHLCSFFTELGQKCHCQAFVKREDIKEYTHSWLLEGV